MAAQDFKVYIARQSIHYLGHVISCNGLSMDPAKIQVIMDWLVPSSVKALREFLGLARYYRKFMQHFGIIAKPSTDLLRVAQTCPVLSPGANTAKLISAFSYRD
jgi:hypothetical protein